MFFLSHPSGDGGEVLLLVCWLLLLLFAMLVMLVVAVYNNGVQAARSSQAALLLCHSIDPSVLQNTLLTLQVALVYFLVKCRRHMTTQHRRH